MGLVEELRPTTQHHGNKRLSRQDQLTNFTLQNLSTNSKLENNHLYQTFIYIKNN